MGEGAAKAPVRPVTFDTDVLVWYLRGSEKARLFFASVARPHRFVSALTVMELVQGCRGDGEVRQVKRFVADHVGSLVHPDEPISHRAMALLASIMRRGTASAWSTH